MVCSLSSRHLTRKTTDPHWTNRFVNKEATITEEEVAIFVIAALDSEFRESALMVASHCQVLRFLCVFLASSAFRFACGSFGAAICFFCVLTRK
jgi:hypothetical protein